MSKAAVRRRIGVKWAYAAATKAGMKVDRVEIEQNGKIILFAANDRLPEHANDLDRELAKFESRRG